MAAERGDIGHDRRDLLESPGAHEGALGTQGRGETRTELRLRVVATPEPATTQLLAHLGLRLPKGTRTTADVVPKNTP
jgi:hypothetical protein